MRSWATGGILGWAGGSVGVEWSDSSGSSQSDSSESEVEWRCGARTWQGTG